MIGSEVDAQFGEVGQMTDQAAASPSAALRQRGPGTATRALAEADRSWLFSGADDLFRNLYTRGGIGAAPEIIAVCSALAGEGKTTVALGLAATLAQDFPSRRIVLVETDFQRPVLAEDFQVEATPGLVEHVLDDEPLEFALRETFLENLHLMPVGGPLTRGGRVLRSTRLATALETLRQNYDVVLLDLPAVVVNSDAVVLADLADGILVVVRAGATPIPVVTKALAQLDEAKVRGVVLNASDSAVPGWLRRLCGF